MIQTIAIFLIVFGAPLVLIAHLVWTAPEMPYDGRD